MAAHEEEDAEMQEEVQDQFSRQHASLVQFLLSSKQVSKSRILTAYKKFFGENHRDSLTEVLSQINQGLDSYASLELRRGYTQAGIETICVVNSVGNDDISQQATSYSPSDINLFKKIIELIMTNSVLPYQCSRTSAINAGVHLVPKIDPTKAQSLLERFIDDKWFEEIRAGSLSFTVRTTLELDHFIKDTYPQDSKNCTYCKDLVLYPYDLCLEDDCDTIMHSYCSSKHFSGNAEKVCPVCEVANWKMASKKLRAEVKEENENETPAKTSQRAKSSSSRSSSASKQSSSVKKSSSKSQSQKSRSKKFIKEESDENDSYASQSMQLGVDTEESDDGELEDVAPTPRPQASSSRSSDLNKRQRALQSSSESD